MPIWRRRFSKPGSPCTVPNMQRAAFISPTQAERESGLGKEQLRKWRQRFGFPPVESTADGKAAYSRRTVDQLVLIKRLLEAGFRPRHVVGRAVGELEAMKASLGVSAPRRGCDEATQALIEHLKLTRTDLTGFRALLAEERAKRTMLAFVRDILTPLLTGVGDAWTRGEIDIHHEHLCTCLIERYLHAEILAFQPKDGLPSVLFAVPPGERHLLGLLMIEAVVAEQGARTINLGSDIPLDRLKGAATSCQVDVVALSFSFAYPARDVVPVLRQLRRLLPVEIPIWAGGAGLSRVMTTRKGVRMISSLDEAVAALKDFPLRHTATETL